MEADRHLTAGCRIAICVASYRRPRGLLALLQSLDALVFEGAAPELRVIVADNDADESAREVCEDAQHWLRHPLTYVVEKRQGIPQARNASLTPALGHVDWVAFVDDDEVVDPRWLDALLRAQQASGADVVTGPVLSRFVEQAPSWIVEGEFLTYPRFADGELRPAAFTGNALVRESVLAGLEMLFDERLEIGEDTELFLRLARRGHRIVWADDALVFEIIPPERTTLAWILGRAYRDGIACVHIDRQHGLRGRTAIALHGAWCLAEGIVMAALPTPRGRSARARSLKRAALGLGRWAGLAGMR